MTQETINALMPLLVSAAVTILTAIIAAIGVEVRKYAAAHANDANADFINKVVEIGVQAAEQVYNAADGTTKKEYALDFAEQWLAARGVKVELDTLDAAVEAAVMREFNYPAAVEPATPPTETTVTMPGGTVGIEGTSA